MGTQMNPDEFRGFLIGLSLGGGALILFVLCILAGQWKSRPECRPEIVGRRAPSAYLLVDGDCQIGHPVMWRRRNENALPPSPVDPRPGASLEPAAGPPTSPSRPVGEAGQPSQSQPDRYTIDQLLDAIREVETGGHPDPANAVGDNGLSRGPYQISEAYWRDAWEHTGVEHMYRELAGDDGWSRITVLRYWLRYMPVNFSIMTRGVGMIENCEALARVHNGGPGGCRKKETAGYWLRVKCAMFHLLAVNRINPPCGE